ncbi:MAG: hypothetical protein IPI49_33565 [Myxococcales bacterium]|nr:hypothetical protein [Myxococcales bacterium]
MATAATEAVLSGYAQHCTASQLETVCRVLSARRRRRQLRAVTPARQRARVAHTTTAPWHGVRKGVPAPDEAALLYAGAAASRGGLTAHG